VQIWRIFAFWVNVYLVSFCKITEVAQIFRLLFTSTSYVLIWGKNGLGKIFGEIFTNSSGRPGTEYQLNISYHTEKV
jgi:hypothetical protein